MIPLIGLMIGIYITIRMLSFILRKEPRSEHIIIKVLAGIGIAITIFCIVAIFQSSSSIPSY